MTHLITGLTVLALIACAWLLPVLLWDVLTLPAAKKTYLGNRESMRFFPTDCAEVQQIKPRNRVFFGTLMDAFMAGYAPARPCNFWPDAK